MGISRGRGRGGGGGRNGGLTNGEKAKGAGAGREVTANKEEKRSGDKEL